MSPRLLDLFCCGGGASEGYRRAGFEVFGVDREPQPHYPFSFLQGDCIDVLDRLLAGEKVPFGDEVNGWRTFTLDDFSALAGSPPCQAHSTLRHRTGIVYEDFISETRERMQKTGLPWIIENVPNAPLIDPITLCGSMFDLGAYCADGEYRQLRRHRIFESNIALVAPGECEHFGQPIGVYGNGGGGFQTRGYKGYASEARAALGIDWLPGAKLSQAIPPAYSEYLGRQLMTEVTS